MVQERLINSTETIKRSSFTMKSSLIVIKKIHLSYQLEEYEVINKVIIAKDK